MKVIDTRLDGVKIVVLDVFGDARGWVIEQYNAELNAIIPIEVL